MHKNHQKLLIRCSIEMVLLIIFCVFIVTIYWYSASSFDYWKKRGVKHDTPLPIFGTNAKAYLLICSMTDLVTEMYRKYPTEKVVGFFRSSSPELIIRDPEIVKKILLVDFYHFHNRKVTSFVDHENEPLFKNVFLAEGDMWRLLRQRTTPAFTSRKLKAMFPLIVERAERLQMILANSHSKAIDVREIMARFTTDIIGACAFGLDADTLNREDSEIRKLGVKIFKVTIKLAAKAILKQAFPQTFKQMKITQAVEENILRMVTAILKQRNYEPSGRNDFIDQLLECRKKGIIVGESIEHFKADGSPETATLEMTEAVIAAQVFVFFAAGFETSSSTSSYTLHLLAHHPHIQSKVQEDIDRALSRHDNKLSYDTIKDMTYLEMVFKESLRIFPSIGFLSRECTKKYTFEDLNLTIDTAVKITIPIQALHMDPIFFDNPEEFRPERFDPRECGSEKTKYVHLPFGEGPRGCIGARLGMMQSMAGLAAVLSQFSVVTASNSKRYPQVEANPSIVQTIKVGLPLLFHKLKK